MFRATELNADGGIDTATRRHVIRVRGIVQGVGFRPFVYGLASDLGLGGFVKNWTGGALIEVEGHVEALDLFAASLRSDPPARALVDSVHVASCAPRGDRRFHIIESECAAAGPVAVSPDLATCDACVRELFDPTDRRYRYPLITCAECGPRLTIVTQAPYDRERTTMKTFGLCGACRAEYTDPRNRRFHAQAIACAVCGPRLRAIDPEGAFLPDADPLTAAVDAVRSGRIVAMKGIGGYHLVCDAGAPGTLAELRRRKGAKPSRSRSWSRMKSPRMRSVRSRWRSVRR